MGDRILDWVFENIMPWLLIGTLLFLVLLIPAVAIDAWERMKSPTFTLRKSEWVCMQNQRIPTTTYVMSNNVMLPITSYHDECHQWNRTVSQ